MICINCNVEDAVHMDKKLCERCFELHICDECGEYSPAMIEVDNPKSRIYKGHAQRLCPVCEQKEIDSV